MRGFGAWSGDDVICCPLGGDGEICMGVIWGGGGGWCHWCVGMEGLLIAGCPRLWDNAAGWIVNGVWIFGPPYVGYGRCIAGYGNGGVCGCCMAWCGAAALNSSCCI